MNSFSEHVIGSVQNCMHQISDDDLLDVFEKLSKIFVQECENRLDGMRSKISYTEPGPEAFDGKKYSKIFMDELSVIGAGGMMYKRPMWLIPGGDKVTLRKMNWNASKDLNNATGGRSNMTTDQNASTSNGGHLSNEGQAVDDNRVTPLTFGQKLVGLTFNPSNDDKVAIAKQKFADAADMLHEAYLGGAMHDPLGAEIYHHAVGEVLNAQMCVVKLLTLRYSKQ